MILEILVLFLAVAGFGFSLWYFRVTSLATGAIDGAMAGLSAMTDSALDDDAKEAAVRRAGFGLIAAAVGMIWRFGLALFLSALPILLADLVGLVSRDKVFALMMRLDYLLYVSALSILLGALLRRLIPATSTPESRFRYSATDRFFHVIAFASPSVLMAASRIEDFLIGRSIRPPVHPPIFITSLPRGGTTAVLNAMHDLPGVATHKYRDMPFLTAPNLWGRLSGGQRRRVSRHQRAHGDGLDIDLDSPEALEEAIWKMFWPARFRGPTIPLWHKDSRKPEADQFLSRHMAKVIHARIKATRLHTPVSCYCSKNNANIARIPYLLQAFPGCRIVVPVRRPECHAGSLLRQHENFLKLQDADPFIARYMRDIGHFEFGLIHKPIEFPGFSAQRFDPMSCNYWLAYWLHAFREILVHRDHCIFVLQDDLRASPQATMMALCRELQLDCGSLGFAHYFHTREDVAPADIYAPGIYKAAAETYEKIARVALRVP
jgi:hypothetical protein